MKIKELESLYDVIHEVYMDVVDMKGGTVIEAGSRMRKPTVLKNVKKVLSLIEEIEDLINKTPRPQRIVYTKEVKPVKKAESKPKSA